MYESLFDGIALAFSLHNLAILFAGVLAGLIFGAIPGFNPSTAMVLLLPLSIHLGAASGIIFLSGIAGAGIYAGSITAILFRAPGTVGSIVTAIDGYAMSRGGRGVEALGISTMASTLGGIFGGFALVLCAPPLAMFATRFSYPEIVLVIVWTFLLIGTASDSFWKTLVAVSMGLLLASFGADPVNGVPRMTFGSFYLYEGIDLLTAIVGIFCVSELMRIVGSENIVDSPERYQGSYRHALQGVMRVLRAPWVVVRSGVIGVLVGVLPAAGAALANTVAYEIQKRSDNTGRKYGSGIPEGVIAAESANNATEGASLIPTMTLGIPGSNIGAVLLAAMILHGVAVGPQIFEKDGVLAYSLVTAIIIANPMMCVLGFAISKHAAYLTKIDIHRILPTLLIMVIVGAFSVRNATFDLWILLLFGIVGYVMSRTGYPLIAFVLPFVLGKPLEQAVIISLKYSDNNPSVFIDSMICKVLAAVIVVTLALNLLRRRPAASLVNE